NRGSGVRIPPLRPPTSHKVRYGIMAKLNQNSSQEQRWSDLALKAQQCDKKAYNELLKEVAQFTASVVAPKLANPDWVNDVTQDVLMSVHKSLHTYSPDRPRPR
ncbi:MAG: hypothetical protein AAF197_12990, partial [Pseudomonadota bacterium]